MFQHAGWLSYSWLSQNELQSVEQKAELEKAGISLFLLYKETK